MRSMLAASAVLALSVVWLEPQAAPAMQAASDDEALHRPLDEILDVYVRDGYVYYAALKQERSRLDRYVALLDVPPATYQRWSRGAQAAFWVNAYNVFVLETVINRYPIRGTARQYPADSIRQIPGAFDRLTHRAAGRSVTLDQIEKAVLAEFRDPRLYLVLGRGAVGSGRLRSEAYTGGRLEEQLAGMTGEFVATPEHVRLDRTANELLVSPIIGWYEQEFVAAYAGLADGRFAERNPIERAIVGLVGPHLYPSERAMLDRNTFVVRYHEFNWRLNDLTGGRR